MTAFDLKFSGVKDSYATGATRDAAAGKGRYDLISTHALRRLAVVYERGAANHGDRNWEHGVPRSRCLNSAMRHLQQAIAGETDEDHLAQCAWNVFAAIHFEATGRTDLDDTRLQPIAAARNPDTDSACAVPAA